MTRHRTVVACTALVLALGLVSTAGSPGNGKVQPGVYVLPNIPLGSFLEELLDLNHVEDHGIRLGGIGSDIWHDDDDPDDVFWMITDRGPNGQIRVPPVTGPNRRTFPIPEFTPLILNVRVDHGAIHILKVLPVSGWQGGRQPVTGLSNTLPRDEQPWDCSATTQVGLNVHGLDTEGFARTPDGTLWIDEEYSPSILRIDPQGIVLRRFVPEGLALPTTTYQTIGNLPRIYSTRKVNRGFEGLTLSKDRRTLYAALQSPLLNPTAAVGNASRNTRILAFDSSSEQVVAEYVYRFQPVTEFGNTDPAEMKVSALAMVDRWRMLVLERTDLIAKVYLVDVRRATDILRSRFDDAATSPSLEALDDAGLAAAGIDVLPKRLILTLDSTTPNSPYPQKIEGITILDERTIAIANDNDFGIGSFDTTPPCTLQDTGFRSRIQIIRLDEPIKSARDHDDDDHGGPGRGGGWDGTGRGGHSQ